MGQTKEQKIIKQLTPQVQKFTPIATDMFLPNHSGQYNNINITGGSIGGKEDIILHSGRKAVLNEPHIKIVPLSSDGYSQIAFYPENNLTKIEGDILINVHKTETGGADHKHLSLYSTKADGNLIKRFNIPYGSDVIDIDFQNSNIIVKEKVGIGTYTPSTELHVNDDGGICAVSVSAKNDSAAQINLGDTDDLDSGFIKYDNATNHMTFRAGGAGTALTIEDDNNIIASGNFQAGGYLSSDGSLGATGTFTTADSKTVTVKNGIITAIV